MKHFIYAKENSETGNKFNKHTINSIKSLYNISTSKYKYDYKETIFEHFQYMSEKMYDGNKQLELTKENNIENNKENNIENNKENNKENVIENNEEKKINNEFNLINQKLIKYITKLKYIGKEKLSLLKMVVDELGFYSLINNDFTPSLDMYYSDKELVISIECPEGAKLTVKKKK